MQVSASGEPAPVFTLDGELPDGLTLSQDGLLSGRPTSYGRYTFALVATNVAGSVTSDPFEVVVGGEPGRIAGPKVLHWVKAERDRVRLRSNVFPRPRYRLVRGALPDGLTLSRSGVLKGRTRESGRHVAVIRMRNSFGAGRDRLVIRVAAQPTSHGESGRPLPPL